MLTRVCFFAAVALLGAAQEDVDENTINFAAVCRDCGGYEVCCDIDSEVLVTSEGVDQCYNEVTGGHCTVCGDCSARQYNTAVTTVTDISGATSSGGFSVGAFVHNGMKGFLNIETAKFYNFPRILNGARATVMEDSANANWYTVFSCTRLPCDLYVFAYRCRMCESRNQDAFHTHMVGRAKFTYNPCGPVFKLTEDGHEHQFSVYHREITEADGVRDEKGAVTVTVAPGLGVDMVWTAVGSKRIACSANNGDEKGCNSRTGCSYTPSTQKCVPYWCSKASCDVCPKIEDGTYNGAVNTWDSPRPGGPADRR